MTTIELSDYMDVRTREQGFVLDPYEKSLLLTLAQEQIVEDLYSNNNSASFEETEKRRRALAPLVYTFEAFRKEEDRPTRTYQRYIGKDENDVPMYETLTYQTATGVNDDKVQGYSFNYFGVVEQPITKELNTYHKIKSNAVNVTLPEKCMYIIYEQVEFSDTDLECLDGNTAVVVPITHDEYYRAMQNPFRRPDEKKVFRLDVGHPFNVMEAHNRVLQLWHKYQENDNYSTPAYMKNETTFGNGTLVGDINPYALRDMDRPQMIELISKYKINKYLCRYLKRPNPIVVDDLPDTLTIYGFHLRSEAETNPILHKVIAENAVQMAIRNRIKQ